MRRYSLLLFALSVLFNSCVDKKEIVSLAHVESSSLELKEIRFDVSPLFPKGCCVRDSFLVIFEPQDKEGILHVYHKEKGVFLKKYGRIGEGPDDFTNPCFLFNNNLCTSQSTLLIGDVAGVYSVAIDSIFNTSETIHRLQTKMPDDLRLYNYVLQNNDSMLVVNQTRDCQLTFYNKRTHTTKFKKYFEKTGNLKDASDFCHAMQIYDAYYSSNADRIVVAYKNWKQIDLISASGDLIKHVYLPDYDYNKTRMSLDEGHLRIEDDAHLFFSFVYPAADYFYALCWDDTKTNIKQGRAKTSIYKFDWEGELKEIFQLDKAISYFCIDDASNVLYAVGISEDDLELTVYSSPI